MLTPVVVELASQRTRTKWQEPRDPRAFPSAVYVPYRRRNANGAVRVATGLVARAAR